MGVSWETCHLRPAAHGHLCLAKMSSEWTWFECLTVKESKRFSRGSYCSRWVILIPALPFCHTELRAPKPKPVQYPNEINTLGDHIRTHRLDLKFLQKQVADQIGVHELTITNWEVNATVPEVRYMPAIIRFLGYDPLLPAVSLPERLATVRRGLGLSQRKMSAKLGVDPATLMGWEAGRHQPTGRSLELIGRVLQIR
jgi:DNA-binding transcriptional regulator YiaG